MSLLRYCQNLLRLESVASALDAAGKYAEADALSAVMVRLSQAVQSSWERMQGTPGLGMMREWQNSALGAQLGLSPVPGQATSSGGARHGVEMTDPAALPGESLQEYQARLHAWRQQNADYLRQLEQAHYQQQAQFYQFPLYDAQGQPVANPNEHLFQQMLFPAAEQDPLLSLRLPEPNNVPLVAPVQPLQPFQPR